MTTEPTEASILALKPKWARELVISQRYRIAALEAEVARLLQRAEDPAGAFAALEQEITGRDEAIGERDKQIRTLQDKIEGKDGEIGKLKEDLEGKDGEIDDVRQEYEHADEAGAWRENLAGLWEQIAERRIADTLVEARTLDGVETGAIAYRAAGLVRAGTAAGQRTGGL